MPYSMCPAAYRIVIIMHTSTAVYTTSRFKFDFFTNVFTNRALREIAIEYAISSSMPNVVKNIPRDVNGRSGFKCNNDAKA